MVVRTAVFLKNPGHASGVNVMNAVLLHMPGTLPTGFGVMVHMPSDNGQDSFPLLLSKRNGFTQI